MPDVETYAPFIDAVFGAPESEALRDSVTPSPTAAARAESSVADALLRSCSTCTAAASRRRRVLALLEDAGRARALRARRGRSRSIRGWVDAAGIRWGIDADHRAQLGLPRFAENTWRAGLDRLLLGYALPATGATLFDGILPVPESRAQLAR